MMEFFELRSILILESDFHLETLIEELGGSDYVKVVVGRNKAYRAIKSAYLDDLLITTTAQDLAQSIVDSHNKLQSLINMDKKVRISEKKQLMNQELYNEVFTYFDTNDREAASTWGSSWQLKKSDPQDYINEGLLVIHTSSNFLVSGEQLTVFSDSPTNEVVDETATEARVLSYYSELVEERLKPFDKFRDLKIKEFLIAKAIIEAE